jgi:lysophospholipase L1-like esterase
VIKIKEKKMAVKIKNNESILFIGDSITDCGRASINRPLGDGYVKLFNDLIITREPAKRMTILNKGIGGNTVKDLQNRWYDDVLCHKPKWLSIKIGINDLHRYLAKTPASVSPKEFLAAYDDILSQTKQKLPKCRILLIEPFYISNETSKTSFRHDVLKLLPEYISVVRKMHQKYRTRIVNTHTLFSKLLNYYESDTFCAEPVHPNATGHVVIAEAVYSALSR